MYVCKWACTQDWGSGGCPQKIFEIRCFEIASGAIFGQKQSRSRLPFHPIFGLVSYICETSWLQISMREGTKVSRTIDNRAIIYGRTVGGVTSTEIQIPSAWHSDLFTHVFTRVNKIKWWEKRTNDQLNSIAITKKQLLLWKKQKNKTKNKNERFFLTFSYR